jgi:carboxylesterase
MEEDPKVLKHGYLLKGSNGKAVLAIHGFGGTPCELYLLAKSLNEAGYEVSVPCLKHHGEDLEELDKSNYHDWIGTVESAYAELKSRFATVYVTGLSMGGLLSLYLAEHHDDIKAVAVMAPALIYKNKSSYLAPMIRVFKKHLPWDGTFKLEPEPAALLDEGVKGTSVPAAIQMTHLQNNVRHHLSKIKAPLLIFQSHADTLVDPKTETYVLNHISSKEKQGVYFEKTSHVMPLDSDREEIFKDIKAFFEQHAE